MFGQVQALSNSMVINSGFLLGAKFVPMPPNVAKGAAANLTDPNELVEGRPTLDEAGKRAARSCTDDVAAAGDDPLMSRPLLDERHTFKEMCQVKPST